jgi:hypothetical protein
MLVFLIGFWALAGFVPPASPTTGAQEIARLFDDHRLLIRVGLFICTTCSALLGMWYAVISVQLRRIEGPHAPLALAQAISAAVTMVVFIFPMLIWQAAAYRPERSAETIQMLNDLAWFQFLGIVSTGMVQNIVIAWAILTDARPRPVFPRWAGYFNIWMALGFTGGGLIPLFKSGPLAWNGIIGWWAVLVSFTLWCLTMSVLLIRAVKSQEREEQLPSSVTEGHRHRSVDDLSADLADLREQFSRIARA